MRACRGVPRQLLARAAGAGARGPERRGVVEQLADRGAECLDVTRGDDAARTEARNRLADAADVVGDRGHACSECAQ